MIQYILIAEREATILFYIHTEKSTEKTLYVNLVGHSSFSSKMQSQIKLINKMKITYMTYDYVTFIYVYSACLINIAVCTKQHYTLICQS